MARYVIIALIALFAAAPAQAGKHHQKCHSHGTVHHCH